MFAPGANDHGQAWGGATGSDRTLARLPSCECCFSHTVTTHLSLHASPRAFSVRAVGLMLVVYEASLTHKRPPGHPDQSVGVASRRVLRRSIIKKIWVRKRRVIYLSLCWCDKKLGLQAS